MTKLELLSRRRAENGEKEERKGVRKAGRFRSGLSASPPLPIQGSEKLELGGGGYRYGMAMEKDLRAAAEAEAAALVCLSAHFLSPPPPSFSLFLLTSKTDFHSPFCPPPCCWLDLRNVKMMLGKKAYFSFILCFKTVGAFDYAKMASLSFPKMSPRLSPFDLALTFSRKMKKNREEERGGDDK